MSRRLLISLLALLFLTGGLAGQAKTARSNPPSDKDMLEDLGWVIIDGDTLYTATMPPLPIFGKKKDFRNYQKLVRSVKKVYPYAKEAKGYLDYLEAELPKMKNDREREKLTKKVEKEIVSTYTPILENMTRSEGKVLIKLIHRETQISSYQILKDFRGGLSAGFWNTIARLFKANLKDTYDPEGEDRMMEQIVKYVEAGLL